MLAGASACSGSAAADASAGAKDSHAATATPRDFSADSAMSYVKAQVDFGPRVPGTTAHDECADWIVAKLSDYGADTVEVIGQPVMTTDGKTVPVKNILARYGTDKRRRILLLAHYDTRPWADHDGDPSQRRAPIDGANDGGSGVAVLLEIARQIGREMPAVGVDLLFTDVEDYGAHADDAAGGDDDTWCLGSQQLAAALPYSAGSAPYMGILLDMVGGRGATFPMEYFSASYAQAPTAKVWAAARRLGLEKRFPHKTGGAINDDHLPMIRAGIPTTDIIETSNPETGSFNPHWHTLGDNIDNIDPTTMADVGHTVLEVIYNEKP